MRELSIATISAGFDGTDMAIKRLLANPEDVEVKDKLQWPCPEVGAKVKLSSFDNQNNIYECIRLNLLPSVTVKAVYPKVMHMGKQGYYWTYDIAIEESKLQFTQFSYYIL